MHEAAQVEIDRGRQASKAGTSQNVRCMSTKASSWCASSAHKRLLTNNPIPNAPPLGPRSSAASAAACAMLLAPLVL